MELPRAMEMSCILMRVVKCEIKWSHLCQGFYNGAVRPSRRGTLHTSSPGATMNFGTGPNHKDSKDSARTPEICPSEELLLPSSDSLSAQSC